MTEAGVVEAVEERMALVPNIRVEPFDTRAGTGAHLTDDSYPYQYEFQTVLAPGARLWRADLSREDIEEFERETGLSVGPDDGLMNLTTAVAPQTYFINVARVSHHVIGGITYAIKALVGTLDRESRIRMHFVLPVKDTLEGLTRPRERPKLGIISEIALARQPEINVIDASKIQLNSGPDDGEIHRLGFHLFFASTDIVATDAVCLGVHKYAYARYRRAHRGLGLPLTYRHLNLNRVVWDHGMIRHAAKLGLGATRGCEVQIEDHVDSHSVTGYPRLHDFLLEHVLSTAPGGRFGVTDCGASGDGLRGC
jgi:hypothetical protein